MIADTGAKNGAGWPHTHLARPQASATATEACTIERQAGRTRRHRVRMDTRERSVASSSDGTWKAGMRSVEGAAVLQQIEPEQRLRERRAGRLPARARVKRARPRLTLGRVQADRPVAPARRL